MHIYQQKCKYQQNVVVLTILLVVFVVFFFFFWFYYLLFHVYVYKYGNMQWSTICVENVYVIFVHMCICDFSVDIHGWDDHGARCEICLNIVYVCF